MPATSIDTPCETHEAYRESRISEKEIEMMGKILMERHGPLAYATAKIFVDEHISTNSKSHAHAWARVAQYIFENMETSVSN